AAAMYQLTVRARYSKGPLGAYEIRILDVRPATAQDISLDEGRRLLFESVEARRAGKYDQSLEAGKRALEIRESVLGPEDPTVASALANAGEVYRLKGEFTSAESLQQRALAIREKAFGPEHPAVAQSLTLLSDVYRQNGNSGKAEAMVQRALEIREKI